MDLSDMASFSSPNIAVTTGCFFGLVQQTLINKGQYDAQRIVEMYAKWYPNTFVEIQNHNIKHSDQETEANPWTNSEIQNDSDICEIMVDIANKVGLPLLATQDSHYCNSQQKVAHELMKRMVYRGGDGVNEFPGDSFHLATTEWVQEHHESKHWKLALLGHVNLTIVLNPLMPISNASIRDAPAPILLLLNGKNRLEIH